LFLINLTYIAPLEEVDRFIDAHCDMLDDLYRKKAIVFSGRKNPRTGGVMLLNVATRAAAEELIHADPFYQAKVAQYDIIDFTPTQYDPAFAVFTT